MVDKELIEIWRNMLKPSISSRLLKTNYEGMGEQDKEEFERDLDEILDLALIGLKHKAQLSQEDTEERTGTHACDLIIRQVAIDAAALSAAEWDGMYVQDINGRIRKALEQLPPAQPEREKGKWIQNDNGTYSCSLCHSWIPEEQHYYAQFCLYCGADMREVKVKRGDEDTLQGGLMSAT